MYGAGRLALLQWLYGRLLHPSTPYDQPTQDRLLLPRTHQL
jgi:hypothetical protein